MTNSSLPQRADHSSQGSRSAVAFNKLVLPIVIVLALAIVGVFALRAYNLNTYTIPSASMEPGLLVGDRIEIDPAAYDNAEPQRGDVIVFDGAGSFFPYESETTAKRFRDNVLGLLGMAPQHNAVVKRVIGLPGDTVECCDNNGQLIVNGDSLDEPYLAQPDRPASASHFFVEVPIDRVFLLGDNRYDSVDSRALLGAPGGGMIQKNKIYGPVISKR